EQPMKRRLLLLFVVALIMVVVGAMAMQQRPTLLVLDWAHKAPKETPPVAVLVEFGVKDLKKTDYSGTAAVSGAKVVHREGYRFRAEDKLVEPNGWSASSRAGVRVPAKTPQVSKMEPIATVGVVRHLADVKDDDRRTL